MCVYLTFGKLVVIWSSFIIQTFYKTYIHFMFEIFRYQNFSDCKSKKHISKGKVVSIIKDINIFF